MAVDDVTGEATALSHIQTAMTLLAAREPDIIKDFARFLTDDRHATFTFSAERGRVYDAVTTVHARRIGSARA